MASPKPIWAYERQFFDLAEQAIREGHATVTFETGSAARAFRSRLYAWREALFSTPEFNPSLAIICPKLRFELEGNEVRIRHIPTRSRSTGARSPAGRTIPR